MQPFFAISWLLTWFAHVVEDWDTIVRIFDSCLASHPLFPIYIAVAVRDYDSVGPSLSLSPYSTSFSSKNTMYLAFFFRFYLIQGHHLPAP